MLSANQIAVFFKSTISYEKIDKTASFLNADTNSEKLKVVWKFFGWAWSKYGFGQSGFWTLKLTLSQEWSGGIY